MLVRPNNSFKPNSLRNNNHMAEKACHVVGSAAQVGLIQALGAIWSIGETSPYKVKLQSKADSPSKLAQGGRVGFPRFA